MTLSEIRDFIAREPLDNDVADALLALIDAAELLARLRQWDALYEPIDAPYGDATYWVREMDRALAPFRDAS